jgi:ribonuclease HI
VTTVPILDLVVYSDSSYQDGRAGADHYITRGPQTGCRQASIGLGDAATSYNAEVIGATAGLAAALQNPLAQYATNVTVCLHNEEAAICLHTGKATRTNAPEFRTFDALKAAWRARPLAGPDRPGTVQVKWIPSHRGITGNTEADTLANIGRTLPPSRTAASYAAAKALSKARFDEALKKYWASSAPTQHQELKVPAQSKMPKELKLSRPILARLLAARSAHGDFHDYHIRFEHEDAVLECSCGANKTPEHFFFCQTEQARARLGTPGRQGNQSAIRWLLGTTMSAKRFETWCLATRFCNDICPLPVRLLPAYRSTRRR